MAKRKELLAALEKAKIEILTIVADNPEEPNDFEHIAHRVAVTRLGSAIDLLINEVQKKGRINEIFKQVTLLALEDTEIKRAPEIKPMMDVYQERANRLIRPLLDKMQSVPA